jgi:hypothetical protein
MEYGVWLIDIRLRGQEMLKNRGYTAPPTVTSRTISILFAAFFHMAESPCRIEPYS